MNSKSCKNSMKVGILVAQSLTDLVTNLILFALIQISFKVITLYTLDYAKSNHK